MKRILAVIVFFAGAASLALSQTADEQEKPKGEKAGCGSWTICILSPTTTIIISREYGNSSTPTRRREQSERDLLTGMESEHTAIRSKHGHNSTCNRLEEGVVRD